MSGLEESQGIAEGRRLGSIQSRINNQKWQEFRTSNSAGFAAIACVIGCSTDPLSQKAPNGSPWTFQSDCSTQLTVMQESGSGDSVWEIIDNGVSLGNTLPGQVGDGCKKDPTECQGESDTGIGQFYLAEGSHTIQIKVVTQTQSLDGGWFKIDNLVCPEPSASPSHSPSVRPSRRPSTHPSNRPSAEPSVSAHPSVRPSLKPSAAPSVSFAPTPTCLAINKSCKLKPTSSTPCCAKFVCRRPRSSGSSRSCLPCVAPNVKCLDAGDCCAGKVCRSASSGGGKKCQVCLANSKVCTANTDCCSKLCFTKPNGKKVCKKK